MIAVTSSKPSSACVKLYGGMCRQNSSSAVTTIFSAGASQNTTAAAACSEMLMAFLWPLLASAPGVSYSSPVMERPCNASRVDDTWCPCVLVPSKEEGIGAFTALWGWKGRGSGDWGSLDPCASEMLLNGVFAVLGASCHCAPSFQDMKRNYVLYKLI